METREYKTKTMYKENPNPTLSPDKWCIGLDIGYSGVKGYGQNSYGCFPSYAVENTGSSRISLGMSPEDHNVIQYRDADGVWNVGASAQDTISASDTGAGSLSLYGRHRYFSPMFKVLFRTGLAQQLRANQFGDPSGKQIILQTGLPPKYIASDQADFMEVMLGRHHFEVKFGTNDWQEFDFTLTPDNIKPIISQPMGTLLSISTSKEIRPTAEAAQYFSKNLLIIDAGFGTLDIFPMRQGEVKLAECETNSHLAMMRVLQDTANEIQTRFNFEVSVPAMQQYLATGTIPAKVGKVFKSTAFNDVLERHSRDICNQALDFTFQSYDIRDYQYLVLTGGTCAAWGNFIRENEMIKYSDTIKVVPGNQGDPSLPYIFSNVRGYYMYSVVK